MVTRAEIANRALRRCGVLPFGDGADHGTTQAALQAYDEVYSYLDSLDIVDWTSTGSVPNEYAFWVVSLTAYNLCDDIAVPDSRYARIARDAQNSEPNIRRVFNSGYTPDETYVSDY